MGDDPGRTANCKRNCDTSACLEANRLSLDRGTVFRWIEDGRMLAFRIGLRKVLIPESEIAECLKPIRTPSMSRCFKRAHGRHIFGRKLCFFAGREDEAPRPIHTCKSSWLRGGWDLVLATLHRHADLFFDSRLV